MEIRDRLKVALETVPMPGSPPALSRSSAWIGLSFLETGLRQNHIRRINETLQLSELDLASRRVELDLSLNLLDEVQAGAGLAYSQMRTRRAHARPLTQQRELLWVPIARLSRHASSPVEVRDAEGVPVPRLTQSESGPMLASGMYHLLRTTLNASPKARDPTAEIYSLLNTTPEARWLIQIALRSLFVEKAQPLKAAPGNALLDASREGVLARRRKLAKSILDNNESLLASYFELLDVALRDNLIIVGLPSSKDEHHLQYLAPVRARPSQASGKMARTFRQLAPRHSGYRVAYKTGLPATVRSYRLAVETEAALTIEKLVISSDADRRPIEGLCRDLSYLSGRLQERNEQVMSSSDSKMLELELETTARSVADLWRRREWQAQRAGGHVHRQRLTSVSKLAKLAIAGRAYPDTDGHFRSSLLVNPYVTAALLQQSAEELSTNSVFLDVSHENDPVSNRAHAYWRHDSPNHSAHDAYAVNASMLLTDAGGTGAVNVGGFILAVLAVTFAIASALYGTPVIWQWTGSSEKVQLAGPMIAVLLLVPGYLYGRLEWPKRTTILSRLRLLPRITAYLSIGSTVTLAAYLASNPSTAALVPGFWAALGVQAVFAAAMISRRTFRGGKVDPWLREVALAAPLWLHLSNGTGQAHKNRSRTYDVYYEIGLEER